MSPRPSQAQPSSATPAQPVPARPTISAAAVPPSAHAAPRCAWPQLPACRCCCIPSCLQQGAVGQVVLWLRAAAAVLTDKGMLGGDRKPVSFDSAASGEASPPPAAGRALGTGLGGLDSSGGAGLDDPAAGWLPLPAPASAACAAASATPVKSTEWRRRSRCVRLRMRCSSIAGFGGEAPTGSSDLGLGMLPAPGPCAAAAAVLLAFSRGGLRCPTVLVLLLQPSSTTLRALLGGAKVPRERECPAERAACRGPVCVGAE